MNTLINIVNFVVVLGIIVLIHELGHLIAAKSFGVYCKEFAIGMGPTLFKFKKPHWETTYSIRLLPLGGFVSMAGEPGEGDMDVSVERTIPGIAPWKRLIIMLAGIFMNMVLALVIFTGLFASQGTVDSPRPIVAGLAENGPAERAGVQVGDEITSLIFFDGETADINSFQDIGTYINIYADRELTLIIDRDGTTQNITLTPEKNGDSYMIGIIAEAGVHRSLDFIESVQMAFSQMASVIGSLFFVLSRLIRGIGTESVGGPIQIYAITAEIQTYGFTYFLQLIALLSVNLGVINALPIPVMDGGRALLTVIEMIIRRPIPKRLENAVMLAGLAMMVLLFIFIMYNDIAKLI